MFRTPRPCVGMATAPLISRTKRVVVVSSRRNCRYVRVRKEIGRGCRIPSATFHSCTVRSLVSPPSRGISIRVNASGDNENTPGPNEDGKSPTPSNPNGDENPEPSDETFFDLLNLLVVTGGIKGSIAVVLGYFLGINSLGLIHPDVTSTLHGLQFAGPVALLDALVMLPKWDGSDEANESKNINPSKVQKIKTALSKYQREEALSNPCRSMSALSDITVATVARVIDEMLERAVVVGFLTAWITDRAVEAGAEPFEVSEVAKYAAVVLVYLYLELRLRSAAKRQKQTMRAFRVERDKITGKQKMIPMDEKELDAVMNNPKNVEKKETNNTAPKLEDSVTEEVLEAVEAIVEDAKGDSKNSETSWSMDDGDVKPKAVDSTDSTDADKNKKPVDPLVLSPGALGASPVGSLLFNNSVKQFFDGFRSRFTLVAQCLCFVTASDHNLWGPIAGGLVCDVLFIAYQREAMARFFQQAEVDQPKGRPPSEREIKSTQMTLVRKDLERKRVDLANSLIDSVDNTPGLNSARDINNQMREVVSEVKEKKGFDKEADALTFVLDKIHEQFPPDKLNQMSESESVDAMRNVFERIREEIRAEELIKKEGEDGASMSDEDDATVEKTLQMLENQEESSEASNDTSSETSSNDTETPAPKKLGTTVGNRPVSLTDLASLARSNEAAPPESIWEAARKEKDAEKAKKEKEFYENNEDLAPVEPLRGVNSTWDALDTLTNGVSEKLANDKEKK